MLLAKVYFSLAALVSKNRDLPTEILIEQEQAPRGQSVPLGFKLSSTPITETNSVQAMNHHTKKLQQIADVVAPNVSFYITGPPNFRLNK